MYTAIEPDAEPKKDMRIHNFNLGGFLFPQFWGIGNGLNIGFLAFVPFIYPIMAIYFGIMGNELALKEYLYVHDGIDAFYKKQKTWTLRAITFWAVILIIITGGFFINNAMNRS